MLNSSITTKLVKASMGPISTMYLAHFTELCSKAPGNGALVSTIVYGAIRVKDMATHKYKIVTIVSTDTMDLGTSFFGFTVSSAEYPRISYP
jgi:predicted transcriptional regulator